MSIDRTKIISGPGAVKLGTAQLYDRDGISASLALETFEGMTSMHGLVNSFRSNRTIQVQFTPSGRLTASVLAALFPHQTPVIGSDPFGATDTACEVHSLAGQKLTLHCAALTAVPQLRLSTSSTAFGGAATITGILKNSTDPTDAAALYTLAAAEFAGTYDPAEMPGGVYTGVWGSGEGAVTFQTADGWTVDIGLAMQPVAVDGLGTVRYMLSGVTARARCQPVGLSESDILGYLNLQGADAGIGTSVLGGDDLVISAAGGITVTLKDAVLKEGPMAWGADRLRIGEIGFVAHRAFAAGVPGALYTVAMTPAA